MNTFAFNNDGLPIYAADGRNLISYPDGTVHEQTGAAVRTNLVGNPTQDAGPHNEIPQPTMLLRVQFLNLMGGRNPAVAAHPGAVAVVARNPARMDTAPIDYASKQGSIIYQQGIKSLYSDNAERFGLKGDLVGLVDNISRRSKACGWEPIFQITEELPGTAINNLVTQHGKVTMSAITLKVAGYTAAGAAVSRDAQNDEMLFQCLMASLSKDAKDVVTLREAEYTCNQEYSGTLLLKIILMESQVDTKSTTMLLHQKLSAGLPDLMAECGSNVKAFNQSVRGLQKKLASRGSVSGEILPQLLFAYNQCDKKDGKFSRYIEQLENAYSDGTVVLTDATLMLKAENKYSELIEKGEFSGASKKEMDSIVALQTEVSNLKSQFGGKESKWKARPGSEGDPKFKEVPKDKRWITEPPKDGESETKVVLGKDYHWCTGHGTAHEPKWVRHEPASCDGLKGKTDGAFGKTKTSMAPKEDVPKKKVAWSTAMMSTIVGTEESDDD